MSNNRIGRKVGNTYISADTNSNLGSALIGFAINDLLSAKNSNFNQNVINFQSFHNSYMEDMHARLMSLSKHLHSRECEDFFRILEFTDPSNQVHKEFQPGKYLSEVLAERINSFAQLDENSLSFVTGGLNIMNANKLLSTDRNRWQSEVDIFLTTLRNWDSHTSNLLSIVEKNIELTRELLDFLEEFGDIGKRITPKLKKFREVEDDYEFSESEKSRFADLTDEADFLNQELISHFEESCALWAVDFPKIFESNLKVVEKLMHKYTEITYEISKYVSKYI